MNTRAALRLVATGAGRRRIALLATALPLFVVTRALLRILEFRTVLRLVTVVPAIARTSADAGEIGWAVGAAASLTRARNNCLAEALAASMLLRAAGIKNRVRFEAARSPAGFIAHAFVAAGDGSVVGASVNPALGILNPAPPRDGHV